MSELEIRLIRMIRKCIAEAMADRYYNNGSLVTAEELIAVLLGEEEEKGETDNG